MEQALKERIDVLRVEVRRRSGKTTTCIDAAKESLPGKCIVVTEKQRAAEMKRALKGSGVTVLRSNELTETRCSVIRDVAVMFDDVHEGLDPHALQWLAKNRNFCVMLSTPR
jgi:hypothetical protein